MSLAILTSLKPYLGFVHPILMLILLVVSLYVLYLGIYVRRTRLAQGELKKELVKGRLGIRHHQLGSILLSLVVIGAIGGMIVTYINNGKILIGPHLFAGLGVVGLIATSAALVPFMQKHLWTRNVHITLNLILLGLFGWQAITGIQILQKILDQMMTKTG